MHWLLRKLGLTREQRTLSASGTERRRPEVERRWRDRFKEATPEEAILDLDAKLALLDRAVGNILDLPVVEDALLAQVREDMEGR